MPRNANPLTARAQKYEPFGNPIPRKLKSPKFWVTSRACFWAFARRVQFFASEPPEGSSFQPRAAEGSSFRQPSTSERRRVRLFRVPLQRIAACNSPEGQRVRDFEALGSRGFAFSHGSWRPRGSGRQRVRVSRPWGRRWPREGSRFWSFPAKRTPGPAECADPVFVPKREFFPINTIQHAHRTTEVG